MVAAMHAENQLYLSRAVLAFALGCDADELERKALLPLRREAMPRRELVERVLRGSEREHLV